MEPQLDELVTMLEELEALLTPPGAWIQGPIARNARGESVNVDDPQAVGWCLGGATDLIELRHGITLPRPLPEALGFVSWSKQVDWSETPGRTQTEVLNRIRASHQALTSA